MVLAATATAIRATCEASREEGGAHDVRTVLEDGRSEANRRYTSYFQVRANKGGVIRAASSLRSSPLYVVFYTLSPLLSPLPAIIVVPTMSLGRAAPVCRGGNVIAAVAGGAHTVVRKISALGEVLRAVVAFRLTVALPSGDVAAQP